MSTESQIFTVTRMAHGGEGIATAEDGRVVFVAGAYPGDQVRAELTKVKKRFARARTLEVLETGRYRGEQTCPAAAHGAGCCDFGDVVPELEAELKAEVLTGQLSRLRGIEIPELSVRALKPHRGWRTRVRLGTDAKGRVGMRRRGSREVITEQRCTQPVPELLDGLAPATGGAEVVAVWDSEGQRHVVETRSAARGRRTEKIIRVLEGPGEVTERVGEHTFVFPPTAFWQAHAAAPEAYSGLVTEWLSDVEADVAWDLYGGVGLFVPAIAQATGEETRIISVDYSEAADIEQPGVERVNARVEEAVAKLPDPEVVVLDPPRTGAGNDVITRVAHTAPQRVIHIGCDPATFARDIRSWWESGYRIQRLELIDAFPGTHHFEVIAQLGR